MCKPIAISYSSRMQMPFGKSSAVRNASINAFYDMAAQVATTLESYEPLGNKNAFAHQSAFVALNDLSLMGSCNTPVRYSVADDQSHYFVMPFKGEANCTIGKKHYVSSPENGAMIIPGEARSGETTDLVMLQATLDSKRLHEVALTMLRDIDPRVITSRLQSPWLLGTHSGKIRFQKVFENICAFADSFNLSTEALNRIGFDDFFYRSVVSHVFHDQFTDQALPIQNAQGAGPIDKICDFIDANLTQTIYLTELEKIGHLSARSIQYEFARRFGCSPMAWVQERRLLLAHKCLKQADNNESVTDIATKCGFTNLGRFSICYRERFGETPSDTLKAGL